MEESAAATHEFPMKRPNDEIGSGSKEEEEASKRAKVEGGSYIIPQFKMSDDFADLEWPEEKTERWCQVQEARYYLISKGKQKLDQAERINSLRDMDDEDFEEFQCKPWKLNAMVGPYDDYQRLVLLDDVGDIIYHDFFFSYDSDILYPKFREEIKQALKKVSSVPLAPDVTLEIYQKYEKLDSFAAGQAIREEVHLWEFEEMKKQMIPILSGLCHEVLKNKRSIELLEEDTTGQVADTCSRAERYIMLDIRHGWGLTKNIINQLERYIRENNEDIFCDKFRLERLVGRYLEENPPGLFIFPTYNEYIERKVRLAENLGIIRIM